MENRKIILVTGGQRSGKSMYAETLALQYDNRPIYIATAEARDEEFLDRVRRHQERRGQEWTTIEEPLHPSNHQIKGHTILLDCVTMLTTNHFFAQHENIDRAFEAICAEIDKLFAIDANFILVTNEIGMGGISANELQRKFTDLLGFTNKYIAKKSDNVIFMISGIPMKIK